MSKINKSQLIKLMSEAGVDDAYDVLETLGKIISDSLCEGHSVVLPTVGLLIPKVKPMGKMVVAGTERKTSEKLKVRMTVSKYMSDKFDAEYSSWSKVKKFGERMSLKSKR